MIARRLAAGSLDLARCPGCAQPNLDPESGSRCVVGLISRRLGFQIRSFEFWHTTGFDGLAACFFRFLTKLPAKNRRKVARPVQEPNNLNLILFIHAKKDQVLLETPDGPYPQAVGRGPWNG